MIPSDIKCSTPGCKSNQKNDKSESYYCLNCSKLTRTTKSFCKACKLAHHTDHVNVNFDEKNYYCKSHFQQYLKYCFNCKKNICEKCESEHQNHLFKSYKFMTPNEDELNKLKDSLKEISKKIRDLKVIVDHLIYCLNGTLRLIQDYYDIANDVIYKYEKFNKNKDKKKELLNFAILKSLHNLKNSNEKILEDIEPLINQKKRINQVQGIIYIYENKKAMYRGDGNENKDSKKDDEDDNDNDKELLEMIKKNEENERAIQAKKEEENKKEEEKKKEEERKKEEEKNKGKGKKVKRKVKNKKSIDNHN